ncbi:MAG: hypothetical protein AB1489_08195 [Acidobacteriota bacterium]
MSNEGRKVICLLISYRSSFFESELGWEHLKNCLEAGLFIKKAKKTSAKCFILAEDEFAIIEQPQ